MLGRPWLHEHGVAASTLYQCPKYYSEGEKKINSDVKPFTMAESHFANAKFFEEHVALKEVTPPAISSTGKGTVNNAKVTHIPPEESGVGRIKPRQQLKEENQQTISTSSIKQANVVVNLAVPVFRYITKSHRKDGQSPFSECTNTKSTTNVSSIKPAGTFSKKRVCFQFIRPTQVN